MADKEVTSTIDISRKETADYITIEGPKIPNTDAKIQINELTNFTRSTYLDIVESDYVTKPSISSSGYFKRRSIRRRSSKRSSRSEPDFGLDTATYEQIRERVLQERAVTNAIDALQERWRMIMFMYDDCVALNKQRAECKLKKLCIQRKLELIMILLAFILVCFPISGVFIILNR